MIDPHGGTPPHPAARSATRGTPRASRRTLFGWGGAAIAGAAIGAGVTAAVDHHGSALDSSPAADTGVVPFYGTQQTGIATPAPARLAFAAYDLTMDGTPAQRRAALIDLLRVWAQAGAAMTAGRPVPGDSTDPAAPPADTGEAYGSRPANRMHIEAWDRDYLADQQNVFGRSKYTGAPLTGTAEHDAPDFSAVGGDGQPVIAANAHIRLAAHENNNDVRILRRGYSFTDGMLADSGELDAGLFFIAFQKDPHSQFVVLQRKLGQSDALNEYIQHVGSGLYACPPGLRGLGDYWGSALLA
jgi:deferrochelatase/peroxidase EfeB